MAKEIIGKFDEFFEVFENNSSIDEEEKTEFKTAQKKVTRKLG